MSMARLDPSVPFRKCKNGGTGRRREGVVHHPPAVSRSSLGLMTGGFASLRNVSPSVFVLPFLPIFLLPVHVPQSRAAPMLTNCHILCIYLRMERDTKKIIKRLKSEGWELARVSGSHHTFKKDDRSVTIPHPKELKIGLAKNIAKQVGWKD